MYLVVEPEMAPASLVSTGVRHSLGVSKLSLFKLLNSDFGEEWKPGIQSLKPHIMLAMGQQSRDRPPRHGQHPLG